jgi:hypothetical protein
VKSIELGDVPPKQKKRQFKELNQGSWLLPIRRYDCDFLARMKNATRVTISANVATEAPMLPTSAMTPRTPPPCPLPPTAGEDEGDDEGDAETDESSAPQRHTQPSLRSGHRSPPSGFSGRSYENDEHRSR